MKIHNTRSPEQWEIISRHIDFKDKTVVDLGCGYGDILLRCQETRASIHAVEKDKELWKQLSRNLLPGYKLYTGSIEDFIELYRGGFDVSICFSVLPYINSPADVLRWMKEHSKIALIECQYEGDGPGFDFIKDNNDMEYWLSMVGWQSVGAIGKTLVEGRNKYRTIWLCQ